MTQPGLGAQSGATDAQSGVADGQGTGTTTAPPAEIGQSAGQTAPPVDPSLDWQAQLTKQQERARAADQRAAAAETALAQLRDKDLPEHEKLKRDYTETLAALEAAREQNRTLAVGNAFSQDNTYDWHNPSAALGMIDRTKVEVAADGTVTGMKLAIKALAEANPWMLRPKSDGSPAAPAVGVPPINGTGAGKTGTNTSEQAKRFPGLRTRLG